MKIFIILYTLLCLLSLLVGKKIYRKQINPLSIYSAIWGADVVLYSTGIIQFHALKKGTISQLFIAHFAYLVGCIIGKLLSRFRIKNLFLRRINDEDRKKTLEKFLKLYSIIASIGIISEVSRFITRFGVVFFRHTADAYLMELNAAETDTLSLAAFIFVAVVLSGVYASTYGITFWSVFPVGLSFIEQIVSGSRGGFVCAIFLFLGAFLVNGINEGTREKLKRNKKIIMRIGMLAILLLGIITYARIHSQSFPYSNSVLVRIPILGGILYNGVRYYCSGLGCLNMYLEAPVVVGYPRLFLRVPIIVLNKVGITHLDTVYRGITYYTPISSNVITLIGELIYDFGSLYWIALMILSIMFSLSYVKASYENTLVSQVVFSVLFTIFGLSFFVYFGRSANLWYALVFGCISAVFVDNKFLLRSKGSE